MTKFFLIGLIALVIVALLIRGQAHNYRDFAAHAKKTSGEIVSKTIRVANPKTQSKEYVVSYAYDVEGSHYSVQTLVEYEDIWQRLRPHQSIDVLYNPDKPADSYLAPVLERRLGAVKALGKQK